MRNGKKDLAARRFVSRPVAMSGRREAGEGAPVGSGLFIYLSIHLFIIPAFGLRGRWDEWTACEKVLFYVLSVLKLRRS